MLHIYMNEHIKERAPTDPVIAIVETSGKKVTQLVYANTVDIRDSQGTVIARVRYNPNGRPGLPHKAKAWIEVYNHNHAKVIR